MVTADKFRDRARLDTLEINGFLIVFETSSRGVGNMEVFHNGVYGYGSQAMLQNTVFTHERKYAPLENRKCPGGEYEQSLLNRRKKQIMQRIYAEEKKKMLDYIRRRETSKLALSNIKGKPKLGMRREEAMKHRRNKASSKPKLQAKSRAAQEFNRLFTTRSELGLSSATQLAI